MKLLILVALFFYTLQSMSMLKVKNGTGNECHPMCSWKCDSPVCKQGEHCPEPTCELVCEKPSCRQGDRVEYCCKCGTSNPVGRFQPAFFFKEAEVDKNCCNCHIKPNTKIEIIGDKDNLGIDVKKTQLLEVKDKIIQSVQVQPTKPSSTIVADFVQTNQNQSQQNTNQDARLNLNTGGKVNTNTFSNLKGETITNPGAGTGTGSTVTNKSTIIFKGRKYAPGEFNFYPHFEIFHHDYRM